MTDISGARAGSATLARARAHGLTIHPPLSKLHSPGSWPRGNPGLLPSASRSHRRISSAMPTQRLGAPRTQRALGVASRESPGCRYGHGFIGRDKDRQLRISERGGKTALLVT